MKKKNEQSHTTNYLNNALDKEIELQEVKKAIKKLRRGKAGGVDNYMNEIYVWRRKDRRSHLVTL